jgi:hypothetical protein
VDASSCTGWRGELRPGSPTDLMQDSLCGAVLIKIILSPPGEREQLAIDPRRNAGQIVDFVLRGPLTTGQTGAEGAQPGR